jgi:hypothetical protein
MARAKRNGMIIVPDKCSNCGQSGPVHGHHFLGYEEAHQLDVHWLCPSCHSSLHAKIRANRVSPLRIITYKKTKVESMGEHHDYYLQLVKEMAKAAIPT